MEKVKASKCKAGLLFECHCLARDIYDAVFWIWGLTSFFKRKKLSELSNHLKQFFFSLKRQRIVDNYF